MRFGVAWITGVLVAIGAAGAEARAERPAMALAAARLKVGDPAPALSVERWLKGGPVAGFERGRVYVVEFWSVVDTPSLLAIPHLSRLQSEFKDKATIVGVTGAYSRGVTREIAEKVVGAAGEAMGYAVAWDRDKDSSGVYMKGQDAPCAFVVDAQGKIAFIGDPMYLDLVLGRVVGGTWGPQGAAEVEEAKKLVEGVGRRDPEAALKAFGELESKYPSVAPTLALPKYQLLIRSGDAGAHAFGAGTVERASKEKDATLLNELAWWIVDPDVKIKGRDLELALSAAEASVRISGGVFGDSLDTLARVYWLKGDKAKAIEAQSRAVAASASEEERKDLQKTLDEYKGG